MVRSRTVAVGLAVTVVVAVLAGSYAVRAVDRPRVVAVENEWGTVTDDRTEIETRLEVRNPRMLRVGSTVVNAEYTVSLNDVALASGSKEDVQLQGDEDTVSLSTWVDNEDISTWWVSHVNRGETTTVEVDPSLVSEYGGMRFQADRLTRTRTFSTDLLAPLQTDRNRRLTAFDRTVLVVEETDASWGNATAERTPMNASMTVRNPLPVPIPLTDFEYTVRMNGIVVGSGVLGEKAVIPAESTRTIPATLRIDNSELDDWWVSHLQDGERSTFSVDFAATVEYRGSEYRLSLDALSYNRTFETDVFASASTRNGSSTEDRATDVSHAPNRDRTSDSGSDGAARAVERDWLHATTRIQASSASATYSTASAGESAAWTPSTSCVSRPATGRS